MFGLSFHLYGLIIGVAAVVSWYALQRVAERYQIFWNDTRWVFLSIFATSFVTARLWHGLTDWSLYQANPIALLAVWRGGMSIIGAIIGGLFATLVLSQVLKRSRHSVQTPFFYTDLLVHALPIGQALGRVANYVNQELYGLPTSLPWGILIDPAHRLPQVQSATHFHPLFLYESLLTAAIAVVLWRKRWQIGRGRATAVYGLLYGLGRFLLDFLRIDRGDHLFFGLGWNQVALLCLVAVSGFVLWRTVSPNKVSQNR